MKIVNFVIPGTPHPKERPRRSANGHFYTPSATVDYEKYVRKCYNAQSGYYFGDSFLKMEIRCYFNIPKSYTGERMKSIDSGQYFPCRNDWDNLGKTVSDALNGVAYKDDSRLYDVHVIKHYCGKGELNERMEVKIWKDYLE